MSGSANRLYATLQLPADADDVSIARAWKKLSQQHHPDNNPDDPRAAARWRAVRLAYEVLIDRERRALYDEFGAASLAAGFDPEKARREREREEREAKRRALAAMVVPTAVERAVATGGAHPRPQWEFTIAIGARLARVGGVLKAKVMVPEPCPDCTGSGRSEKPCRSCKGARQVLARRIDPCAPCRGLGLVGEWISCRSCRGTGTRTRSGCRKCGNAGTVVKRSDCGACDGRGLHVVRFEQPCTACRTTGKEACRRCDGGGKVRKPRPLKLRIARGTRGDLVYRYPGAGFSGDADAPSDLLLRFELLARAPARRRRRR